MVDRRGEAGELHRLSLNLVEIGLPTDADRRLPESEVLAAAKDERIGFTVSSCNEIETVKRDDLDKLNPTAVELRVEAAELRQIIGFLQLRQEAIPQWNLESIRVVPAARAAYQGRQNVPELWSVVFVLVRLDPAA
ncbi:MAG: hypothetical protein KDA96_18975 [Planctomycetaceae bacterium]|nr:hypothetical protein [Planctomycetaceae bacterium]